MSELTKTRMDTVKSSSIKQKDDFQQIIENFSTFKCHDLSYTYYTPKDKINRHLKRINEQSVDCPSTKRLNRSSVSLFNFKRNCFICDQHCKSTPDHKNPDHWKKNRMPGSWLWERQQKLQRSSTGCWLYFLLQTHSSFNLKDQSFVYSLVKRF